MAEKIIMSSEEKEHLIEGMKVRLAEIEKNPENYRDGAAEKYRKFINNYKPGRTMTVEHLDK